MAVFNTFTFDGENSLDYGVYITGEAVYNAPERAVEMVSIPGKNGALALDQGRFENIEVTYPAGTFGVEQTEFAGRMRAMRNMLASRYNYVRLTDSYHPDEFRLGLYKSGLEASPVAMSSAGEFDITFNCKPQRFLTSGEEPVDTSELGGEVTTNRDPYLFRRAGGGSIGHDFDAEIDKLIGGTVAWNQLVQNGNFASNTTGWSNSHSTITHITGGGAKISNGTTAYPGIQIAYDYRPSYVSGHKYLLSISAKGESGGELFGVNNGNGMNMAIGTLTTSTNRFDAVFSATNTQTSYLIIYSTPQANVFSIYAVMLIDLTQAFGTEIADYVYSLEQTTEGSGVAWLKSHGFLTKDYYAYNAGSLLSVKTSEHRTSGFNALNPNADKIKGDYNLEVGAVLPSTSPTASTSGTNPISVVVGNAWDMVTFISDELIANNTYTADYTITGSTDNSKVRGTVYLIDDTYTVVEKIRVIQGSSGLKYTDVFTPSKTGLKFALAVSSSSAQTLTIEDLCVHLGEGNYEPYHINSYPLDSDLELRGKFKLDANNNLYAEGDVYESSGNVTRKYGIVDLGTLNWNINGAVSGGTQYVTSVSGKKYGKLNMICSALEVKDSTEIGTVVGRVNSVNVSVNSAITNDAVAFKASMDGVQLVYELATPTTETADPYANPQIVSPYGTEEYVDTRDVPIPVGHETEYGMSQLVLTNPTEFPSKPLLEVTGVGTFWLGDTLFTITGTAGQTIYIDCETGEAWKNTGGIITPANGLVSLNRLDFPELDPGDTPVMYGTGISKVVVTPRWWII